MSIPEIKPIIINGRFSTPSAFGHYARTGRSYMDAKQHTQQGALPQPAVGGAARKELVDAQAPEDYLWGEFWAGVDERVEAERSGLGAEPMQDAGDEEASETAPKGKDAISRFREAVGLAPADASPMGVPDPNPAMYRFVWPPGKTGLRYIELIPDANAMVRLGTSQFRVDAERFVVFSQILPTPVHVSPLAIAILREVEPCHRFTDAISSAVRLRLLTFLVHDPDLSQREHKTMCERFFKTIYRAVSWSFHERLDAILPDPAKAALETREERERWVRAAGPIFDQYSLDIIHALEWYLMDMMTIPYNMRPYLMTPRILPGLAGFDANPTAYQILFSNLSNYVGQRNMIFCGIQNPNTKVYTAIDPSAWMAMNLSDPPLGERMAMLSKWDTNNAQQKAHASRCLFGTYGGWIDLHTLWEFARFHTPNPGVTGRLGRRAFDENQRSRVQEEEPAPMDQGDD